MLGWFSDKKSLTPVPSSAIHKEEKEPPLSVSEYGQQKSRPHEALGTSPPTPHDDILAELYGGRKDSGEILPADRNTRERIGDEKVQEPPTQSQPARSNGVLVTYSDPPAIIPEPLYDPFSGAQLGVIMPSPIHIPRDDLAIQDEGLWTHLGRILELQKQVALKHIEMESIGLQAKAKQKQAAHPPDGNKLRKTDRHWERANDGDVDGDKSGIGDGAESDDGDEGLGADEETERKKAREEAFARLDDKFTGRKEAIDDIMANVGPPF
jgi:hypothetical protein